MLYVYLLLVQLIYLVLVIEIRGFPWRIEMLLFFHFVFLLEDMRPRTARGPF